MFASRRFLMTFYARWQSRRMIAYLLCAIKSRPRHIHPARRASLPTAPTSHWTSSGTTPRTAASWARLVQLCWAWCRRRSRLYSETSSTTPPSSACTLWTPCTSTPRSHPRAVCHARSNSFACSHIDYTLITR